MRRIIISACSAVLLGFGSAQAQDTARVADSLTRPADTARVGRVAYIGMKAVDIGRRAVVVARKGERVMFGVDSAAEVWKQHDDRVSRTLRQLSPVAFWIPVAAVPATPIVWADESQDGNILNARYARSATAALALGLIASRTTKHFIHRARPCTGEGPGDVSVGRQSDSLQGCPKGSHVGAYSSFFSEHTVALFAIASAATFQAQREQAPNAATIAGVAFGAASVGSIARLYQHHHWLSDVVIGAAVGTGAGWLSAQLGPRAPR